MQLLKQRQLLGQCRLPSAGESCVTPTYQGYGAEARRSVDDLITLGLLQVGHSYRIQFMVHDGDQNKVGGDTGQACMTVVIPAP